MRFGGLLPRAKSVAVMIQEAESLICGFLEALGRAELGEPTKPIAHELLRGPHRAHALPRDRCAVYVFSLCQAWGNTCPAGPNFVLKVGKAGANSSPRFQYQHYNLKSAGSNVAKSLVNSKVLWPHLGIAHLAEAQAGDWIRQNTDRDHFYLESADMTYLPELERFIRGIVGPAFEGG